MSEAWFDAQDVEKEASNGKSFVVKDVLFFHLRKASVHDTNAADFSFDGIAEESHLKTYKEALEKFLGDEKYLFRGFVVVEKKHKDPVISLLEVPVVSLPEPPVVCEEKIELDEGA